MALPWCTVSFGDLIKGYGTIQSNLLKQVKEVADKPSEAQPGKFLLLQFAMSQVTQIGDSISNMISQVMSMINMSVRNQKAQ
jgi:hypothetical protein